MTDPDLMRMLQAVGDPIRMELVFLVGSRGPMNVTDIASHFKLSRPAVSHHLKVLKDAGVLAGEKRSKEVYYRLNRRRAVNALRSLADAIESCCPTDENDARR
ncbi:metalloregulator ArsR/SmtB family transcription factor [Carboxydochorda subterranea]|uniref:Metalloregulator ArsR/SmtB family transcription factor n=1 Tax=Carboxydichorda subterranea TaxID=3109565 RepID=A0ABZ1C1W3_9FIRM|nr:metalloregulator ArsR/SmtB family transcription factor [Limnochorda sp. L945t]WRP18756.1 metalloregulator ArsR/SmtB family transcription factor [Limnochorda sp. L945t]